MKRDFSGWGVIVCGVLLACGGLYAMAAGWEYVQLERGWSQFIAGSVALSGGVVTVAIGRLIRVLLGYERFTPIDRREPATFAPPLKPGPGTQVENGGVPPVAQRPASTNAGSPGAIASPREPAHGQIDPARVPAPHEIDRYAAGDSTYVMMSDGSVEMHSPTEVRRYPTIAALRADAALRRE